ncbi:SHOCT-like domain-containing protein [Beduinella massiliensis]|uniref:SHOCT-like domain-containing protein n=1 Tax=Beduinella massiliensis TaxID=1852363 RepID=UPI000C833B4B
MDEKMRILRMVEQGTVTAEQAAELMAALNADAPGPLAAPEASRYDKKLLRVLVESAEGDNVKIQFPVGAIKKIVKATGKLPISEASLQGVDLTEVMEAVSECLDAEVEGDFVNVESADGTTVRIFVN